MTSTPDNELLGRYGRQGDEAAFGELVRRHIDVVCSVTLGQVGGDAEAAKDVTQEVFKDLARKAEDLVAHPCLAAWLFVSARYHAANARRAERRRRNRERKASEMELVENESGTDRGREELYPVLDQALCQLKAKDRQAILLRFFENCSFSGVGQRLGLSENAARMRVDRAVEKLNRVFARRGITSSTAGLAGLLTTRATLSAPAGLAAEVTRSALSGAAAPAATSLWGQVVEAVGTKSVVAVVGISLLVGIPLAFRSASDDPTTEEAAVETESPRSGISTDASAANGPAAEPFEAGSPMALQLAGEPEPDADLRLALVAADGGEPIEGVRVESWIWTPNGVDTREWLSDGDGICAIEFPAPPERLRLTSRMEGFADTRLEWRPDRGEAIPDSYRLELQPAVPIGGRVVDAAGEPVADAEVGLNHERLLAEEARPESHAFGWIQVTTDEQGRWRVARIADRMIGRVQGSAKHPDHVKSSRLDVSRDPEAEQALRAGTFTFRLRSAVTVHGKVTAPNGYPILGAKVLVGHIGAMSSREATTDANGRFAIPGCKPGQQLITAEAEGYAVTTRRVNIEAGGDPIDLVVQEGREVRLRVVDPDGVPIAGARVGLDTFGPERIDFDRPAPVPPQTRFQAKTGEDGRVVWRQAPNGDLTFEASASGYMPSGKVTVEPGDTETTVTLRPALEVHGIVRDAQSGEPIPEFRIVCGTPSRSQAAAAEPQWSRLERFWLDFAGGRFHHVFDEPIVRGRTNRGYLLKFEADGYAPYVSRRIDADEREVDLTIDLEPASPLEVSFLTPEGAPAGRANVGIRKAGHNLTLLPHRILARSAGAVRIANEEGAVQLPGDDSFRGIVVVHPTGYAELPAEELEEAPEVRLSPWARLEGVLTDGQSPIARQKLRLRFPSQERSDLALDDETFRAETDSDGRFAFPAVPGGRLELVPFSETFSPEPDVGRSVRYGSGVELTLEPGEERTLKLQLGSE